MLQKQNLDPLKNVFHNEICFNLPRILSLIDTDRTSTSFGLADRYRWAWGLIDFGNATFQGLANGLSRLWVAGLWPYETTSRTFVDRIDAFFLGAKNLTQKDGSLEEAFPNEGSYCVTALVAFDLLVTIDLLDKLIDEEKKNEWLNIIEPMVRYLVESDETHAFISNHLATAAAALFRWCEISGRDAGASSKAELVISRILQNQSKEGWFKEYEGADPGYQTLSTYYLADLYLNQKHLNLSDPLSRSIQFLWNFAHPDGSFGGYYGSRSTRFYNPGGILALSEEIPEARVLSAFMVRSISESKVVSLSSMDEPNLVPMFNSFAWAASLIKNSSLEEFSLVKDLELPCHDQKPFRQNFSEAGLLIDRGSESYSIINYKKGGVVHHYVGNNLKVVDTGVVFENSQKRLGSSQHFDENLQFELKEDNLIIRNQVVEMPKKLPSPIKFLALRICCLTIFRFAVIRELTKRFLVKYLITKPKKWPIWNEREIHLGKKLRIKDKSEVSPGFRKLDMEQPFVPIHMSSKGYWQIQDEQSSQ